MVKPKYKIDWDDLDKKDFKHMLSTPISKTFKSFQEHKKECNSCQFNVKTVKGLIVCKAVNVQQAASAGIILGTLGHFTPAITGEDAAAKGALGVAASSAVYNVLVKGFKIKQNPMVEIPLTIAGIAAANKLDEYPSLGYVPLGLSADHLSVQASLIIFL